MGLIEQLTSPTTKIAALAVAGIDSCIKTLTLDVKDTCNLQHTVKLYPRKHDNTKLQLRVLTEGKFTIVFVTPNLNSRKATNQELVK